MKMGLTIRYFSVIPLHIMAQKREKYSQLNLVDDREVLRADDLQHQHRRYWVFVSLLVIILLVAVIRIRLADAPLERDEGEYSYAGQLILQGVPPYKMFYSMKLPGIYAAYAGILAVFGQTHTGIHLALLFVNIFTIILVYYLAERVSGPLAGVTAAMCFAILSMSQSVQGIFANAEHFVILPAVGGLILLLKGLEEDRSWILFSSGLLFGTGFLMKQHGAAFAALGGLYVLIYTIRKKPLNLLNITSRCVLFALGVTVPYGLTCLILLCAGVFDSFWFWTVKYSMDYSSQIPIEYAWENFKNEFLKIVGSAPLIWILACFGLTAVLWERRAFFILIFTIFSFLAICPGFYFRPHYFVLTLPSVAILTGISISVVLNKLSNVRFKIIRYGLPSLLAATCFVSSLYHQWQFLFKLTPTQACRSTYYLDPFPEYLNPFPESLEISRFIREHTNEEDKIAVIGSEPQIYFYSKRHSATGYIYMYPLMETHDFALQMQKEMIREIESEKPKYLILVQVGASWARRPDSHEHIFNWLQHYPAKYYKLVGAIDMFRDRTQYHWTPHLKWPPSSSNWIAVLERKQIL